MPRLRVRTRHVLGVLFFGIGLVVGWQLIPPRPRAVFDPGPPTGAGGSRGIASQDGTKVAIGGIPAVTVWDTATRQQIASLPGEWLPSKPENRRQTWPRVFSPDGSKLVTMYHESGHWHLHVWDLNAGTSRRIFSGSRYMEGVLFSPDSRTLYIRSLEPVPMVKWKFILSAWNLSTGERDIITMLDREYRKLAFSPDGRLLAFATLCNKKNPGHLFIWDIVEGKKRLAIPIEEWHEHLTFTSDGQTLISADLGKVTVWDVATGKQRYRFPAFSEWYDPVRIGLDPRNEVVAIQFQSMLQYEPWAKSLPLWVKGWLAWETTALFDVKTGRRLGTLPEEMFLAFADEGRSLLTMGSDGKIRWWDVPPGKPYLWIAFAAVVCGLIPLVVPFGWNLLGSFRKGGVLPSEPLSRPVGA
jgi:WD40 repeat protein